MNTFMVLLAVLLSVFCTSFADEEEFRVKFAQEVHAAGGKCIVEAGSNDDEFKGLLNHELPDSHEGQCMINCLYKHFKVLTDDGKTNPQGVVETLSRFKTSDSELYEKLVKIAFACNAKAKIDADPCVTARSLSECAVAEGKKLGIGGEIFDL